MQKNLSPDAEPLSAPPLENAVDLQWAAPAGSFSGPVLFILVKFTNVAASTTEAQWGTFVSSGILDYYSKTSHGRVTLTPASESFGAVNNGVVGWLSLNYAHPNTAGNTSTANQQLTKDAILAADPYVNFAAYDKNGDGYIDSQELAIVVVAAGYETSYSSAYSPSVWGHKWSIWAVSPPVVDSKIVGDYHSGAGGYAQFGELHRSSASDQHQATVGIMVHELGHLVFGLPDLYDTDYSSSGIGNFCLMSGGSWGKATTDSWYGQSPVLASAWVRYNRSWDDYKEASGTVSITAAGDTTATTANTLYRASSSLSSEYFLVENREPVGYDRGIQGLIGNFGGLAIWHVDSTQSDNTNDARRLDDLEEADGTAMGTTRGQPTDLWYAGNAVTFNSTSNPNSTLYSGAASGVSIASISAANTVMTATFGTVSTTTVVSSPNPSTYGQAVKFTATVSPATATGTVTFKDGTTILGTGTLAAGSASFSTAALAVGAHSVTAVYAGDGSYTGSTSAALTQTVNKRNSYTVVESTLNPSTSGQTVDLFVAVWPFSATGTVTFMDGTTSLGTTSVSAGTASYSTAALAVGNHAITAVFSGDGTYAGSRSATLTQVVGK